MAQHGAGRPPELFEEESRLRAPGGADRGSKGGSGFILETQKVPTIYLESPMTEIKNNNRRSWLVGKQALAEDGHPRGGLGPLGRFPLLI